MNEENGNAGGSGDLPDLNPLVPDGDHQASNPYRPSVSPDELQAPLLPDLGSGLATTRRGLLTCYFGMCIVGFGILGGLLLGLSVGFLGGTSAMIIAGLIGVLVALASLAGVIATVVGQVMCLAVPVNSGCKRYLRIVLWMHFAWLIFNFGIPILFGVTGFSGKFGFVSEGLGSGLGSLTQLVGLICFVIFLKKLALYLGQLDLVSTASSIMWWGGGLGICCLVMIFVSVIASFGPGGWFALLLLAFVVVAILLTWLRFLRLIYGIANAIRDGGA